MTLFNPRWIPALLVTAASVANAAHPLETAVAEYRELPVGFRLDGTVEAVNQATVSAQTTGRVEEILFDVDDYVEQGAVIIRLRDKEQKARFSRAEAERKEAEARLKESEDAYERTRAVYRKKLVAKSKLDEAESALKAARARYEAAEAGLTQAREQLGYTLIKAPYAGIVTARHVEVGETAHPGQPLMTGLSLDELRVIVHVPQSLIPAIRRHNAARVLNPESNESVETGKITLFPIADPATHTFKLRLDLPPGVTGFFPGMFVKTRFRLDSERVLTIPAACIIHRSEVTAVYVLSPQGRPVLRQIRTGGEAGDGRTVVLAGLDEGERVATDPIAAGARLKQGE